MDGSGNHPARIRLLLADDQPRVRRSLQALLTAIRWSNPSPIAIPIELVGEAGTGQHVLDAIQALHPHVVVLDIPIHNAAHLPPTAGSVMDGLATIRAIKEQWPAVRIVVLTLYATDRAAILEAGADIFLLKGCPTRDLLEAVMPAAS
jgi:DNA-binding NarL/FixJ family response regulator